MTRYSEEGYVMGMCDVFAIAAHRYLKKPMYVVRGAYKNKRYNPRCSEEEPEPEFLYENCHAVVMVGDDEYLDVRGISDGDSLKEGCQFENPVRWKEISPVESEEEMSSLIACASVDESDVLDAMDLVREVWERELGKKRDA